jgi:hypothetical protein
VEIPNNLITSPEVYIYYNNLEAEDDTVLETVCYEFFDTSIQILHLPLIV